MQFTLKASEGMDATESVRCSVKKLLVVETNAFVVICLRTWVFAVAKLIPSVSIGVHTETKAEHVQSACFSDVPHAERSRAFVCGRLVYSDK